MADTKISQMPSATSLTGAEIIPMVQGGINVQATLATTIASFRKYGSFYDTTTQTAAANTPTLITLNSNSINAYGVTVNASARSQIILAAPATYNVQFSAQINSNDINDSDTVTIWFKQNGTNIANSASALSLPKKVGNVFGSTIMTVNIFVVTTVANEYVQLAWNSLLGTSNLTAFTAVNGIPAIPSIIVTVEQVS
jgi:hypothetical protein